MPTPAEPVRREPARRITLYGRDRLPPGGRDRLPPAPDIAAPGAAPGAGPVPGPANDRDAPGPRSIGRVADLERHVPPQWWDEIFDALYLKTDGDVFENAANTAADVDGLIAATGIHQGDPILDLCCGQGRHSLELARRGYGPVTGFDRSRYLVGLARRRARSAGLAVRFLNGDARHCRLAEASFGCVAVLGNSFGYFASAADDAALVERAHAMLRPGGALALDLVDGDWLSDNFAKRSWEWIDARLLVVRERSLAQDGERLITREVVVDADRGVLADRFFAERLYGRERIAGLLDAVGFTDLAFHDAAASASERDADLGMMARRHLVTGRRSLLRPPPGRNRAPADVVVLLGDPLLPDRVKPESRFGAADIATVAKLKAALAQLPEYRFRYLDDHGVLLSELLSSRAAPRPALVMNLCDEGFANDAAMEGHLPALLDILGLPYSGAGPACLAMSYDKAAVRALAEGLGIAVPREILVGAEDPLDAVPARLRSLLPALVKPCCGDNSQGIDEHSVVATPEAALEALRRLRGLMPGQPMLVQEFLPGAEYSVGALGNPGQGFELLPVLEVDYAALDAGLPRILAYASKWEPRSPYAERIGYRRAALLPATEARLADAVTRLFTRLGCRDYARFDFRADARGEIRLLEANPNPGWCWDGKLAMMAGFAGLSYAELLRRILTAAQRRTAGLGPRPPITRLPTRISNGRPGRPRPSRPGAALPAPGAPDLAGGAGT